MLNVENNRVDTVLCRPGNDTIVIDLNDSWSSCETIQHTIYGEYGEDEVFATDQEVDKIMCGDGNDVVYADEIDTAAADCETVFS